MYVRHAGVGEPITATIATASLVVKGVTEVANGLRSIFGGGQKKYAVSREEITQWYQMVLKRAPDEGGLKNWYEGSTYKDHDTLFRDFIKDANVERDQNGMVTYEEELQSGRVYKNEALSAVTRVDVIGWFERDLARSPSSEQEVRQYIEAGKTNDRTAVYNSFRQKYGLAPVSASGSGSLLPVVVGIGLMLLS